jgi:hypothetical protein
MTVDSPENFFWFQDAKIPVATASQNISADAFSADGPAFRAIGDSGLEVYRHADPGGDISMLAHYAGHVFMASEDDTYLIWSVGGEPEGFYHDPSAGFNTIDGEALVDTIVSPITALAANETSVYIFMRNGIIRGVGSWLLSSDNTDRDAQFRVVQQNSTGAVSPNVEVVDEEIYFTSEAAPAVVSGGVAYVLDSPAIRAEWLGRENVGDRYAGVAYDINKRQVLFSYKRNSDVSVEQVMDRVLCYDISKQQYCAPYTLTTTSMDTMRQVSAGIEVGTHVYLGFPYGCYGEFGTGSGDGIAAGDVDEEAVTAGFTATTATVSGTPYIANEHRGKSVLILDRETGAFEYRLISTNTVNVVSWDEPLTVSFGTFNDPAILIGGVPRLLHVALPRKDHAIVDAIWLSMQDLARIYE